MALVEDNLLSPLQAELLALLKATSPLFRDQLVIETGYPRTTVYDNLVRLENRGLVRRVHQHRNTRGRPITQWCVEES